MGFKEFNELTFLNSKIVKKKSKYIKSCGYNVPRCAQKRNHI